MEKRDEEMQVTVVNVSLIVSVSEWWRARQSRGNRLL